MSLVNPQLVALYAAALSAMIAAISYYGKVRHERRRSLRAVLFQILHFRALTIRAAGALDYIPKAMVAAIELSLQRYDFGIPDGSFEELRERIARQVHDSTLDGFVNECLAMVAPLSKALSDLARDDPVLAYRLSIQSMLNRQRFRTESDGEIEPAELIRDAALTMAVENALWEPQILALTLIAKIAARRCGLATWFRVSRELRIPRSELDPKAAAALLERAIAPLVESCINEVDVALQSKASAPSET